MGGKFKKQILFYRRRLLTFKATWRSKGVPWKAGPPPNGGVSRTESCNRSRDKSSGGPLRTLPTLSFQYASKQRVKDGWDASYLVIKKFTFQQIQYITDNISKLQIILPVFVANSCSQGGKMATRGFWSSNTITVYCLYAFRKITGKVCVLIWKTGSCVDWIR